MLSLAARPAVLVSFFAMSVATFNACSTDASSKRGGASDAGDPNAAEEGDGAACGPVVTTPGETCVGFGAGEPCAEACGLYGYVCFDGAPPGFDGCHQVRDTAAGQTYCCPKNDCVAQPDQDSTCTVSARSHRYQCPPNGEGGNVTPPSGCKETGAGATAVEKFYCCP